MWRNGEPAQGRGRAARTAPRSTSTPRAPRRRTSACSRTRRRRDVSFVHPFDDPVLQAGHGSLGLEVEEDLPGVDTIVVPIGGGGLVSGVASAVGCRVVGCRAGDGSHADRGAGRRRSRLASSPDPSPTGSTRRSPASTRSLSSAIAWTRSCSCPRTRSPRGCAFSTAARSSRASRPGPPRPAALLAGKIAVEPGSTVVAVVSGGNADPKVAAAILAEA